MQDRAKIADLMITGDEIASLQAEADIQILPHGNGKVHIGGIAQVGNLALDGNTIHSTSSNTTITSYTKCAIWRSS